MQEIRALTHLHFIMNMLWCKSQSDVPAKAGTDSVFINFQSAKIYILNDVMENCSPPAIQEELFLRKNSLIVTNRLWECLFLMGDVSWIWQTGEETTPFSLLAKSTERHNKVRLVIGNIS